MEKGLQSRKKFIRHLSLMTFGSVLAQDVVFAHKLSPTLLALMNGNEELKGLSKNEKLTVLNNRPWNIEAPAHLLDEEVTSSKNA